MIASDNPLFKFLYKNCWSWGFTSPLKNKEGKYEGGPAPVHRNPDPIMVIVFVLINIVILAIILILYLNEAIIKNNENLEFPGLFIVGILFSGFNAGFFVCVFLVEDASDQEWSRYFVIMTLDFLAHLLYVIVGFAQAGSKKDMSSSIKGALFATLTLGAVVTVLLAYLVYSFAKKIYMGNDFLSYHDEPQIQVSDRLEFI